MNMPSMLSVIFNNDFDAMQAAGHLHPPSAPQQPIAHRYTATLIPCISLPHFPPWS